MIKKIFFSLSNIRTILFLFLIQISSSLLFLGMEIILTKKLNTSDFGDYSVAYSAATIAYIICLLGADLTIFKVIGSTEKLNNQSIIKSFLIYTFITIIFMSVLYYLIAFMGYLITKYILFFRHLHPIFITIIFIPFMAMSFFFYKILIALLSPIYANLIFRLLLTLLMLAVTLIIFTNDSHYSTNIIILMIMLPWVVICLVLFRIVLRRLNIFNIKAEKPQIKEWINIGLSGLPYNLVIITISYLGVIGAEIFLTDEKMVGIFAAAAFSSQIISNNIIICIQSLVLPHIVIAIHKESMAQLRKIIIRNIMIMTLLTILMLIVVYLYGQNILSIYGQEYIKGDNLFAIFILIQGFVWIGFLSVPTLLYLGKSRFVIFSSILLILFLILFISIFGCIFQELGIAFGILFIVALIFLSQTLYVYKLTYQ